MVNRELIQGELSAVEEDWKALAKVQPLQDPGNSINRQKSILLKSVPPKQSEVPKLNKTQAKSGLPKTKYDPSRRRQPSGLGFPQSIIQEFS